LGYHFADSQSWNGGVEMNQFKVGDMVKLKSGGPKMTVNSILANGKLMCAWFDGTNKPNKEQFHPDALKIAE
jgi:uncharacterized protein YodC (DUF2158 family)